VVKGWWQPWVALAVGVSVVALVSRAQTPETALTLVPGLYVVDGAGFDGKAYDGFVEIKEHGPQLALRWELRGGDTAVAYAIPDGEVVSYIFQTSAGDVGYGHVRRTATGWRGKWGGPGIPAVGVETWTPTALSLEQLRATLVGKPIAL
jgi:hypothetical protein